eukprot:4066448-Pyramimonas_sp.AAC.1
MRATDKDATSDDALRIVSDIERQASTLHRRLRLLTPANHKCQASIDISPDHTINAIQQAIRNGAIDAITTRRPYRA